MVITVISGSVNACCIELIQLFQRWIDLVRDVKVVKMPVGWEIME